MNVSSVIYPCPRRSWVSLSISILTSLLIVFSISRLGSHKPKKVKVVEKNLIALNFVMPDIKNLEEPDPVVNNEEMAPKTDLGTPAPMLADLPQIPQPTDFVQQIDFSSLVDKPDINLTKVWTVPENIRRGGRGSDGLGNVFNLADLDRIPEPVMQPAPVYPQMLKREGIHMTVIVDFIVDTEGRVINASAIDMTGSRREFDEAAVAGVSKWRFRAGLKGGRKVNTRMRVPILFKVVDENS